MQRFKISLLGFFFFSSIVIFAQENRTFDGTNNNLENKDWGAAKGDIIRIGNANYIDGSTPNDIDMPNPRTVSNVVFDQQENLFDSYGHSDYVWAFGQFLDHDISLVKDDEAEFLPIPVPVGDQIFEAGSIIAMTRSEAKEGTGTDIDNPRQYLNDVTSFIDGSMIYGSDDARANWLRTNKGDGKLRLFEGFLPWNTENGRYNSSPVTDGSVPFMDDGRVGQAKLFVAGDVRANENPLLTCLHTLFVREHNKLCDVYRDKNPNWTGEQIYQKARKMIGAYLQSITYYEWLPSMGINLPNYNGYRPDVNPNIFNVFSAAAFRLGHTLIGSDIIRMGNDGEIIEEGNSSILNSFFDPLEVFIEVGAIEPYLKGMATQSQQEMDAKMIDDLRNFLFGPSRGLDLAAININRGRERGLATYNDVRNNFGLPLFNSFEDLTDNPDLAAQMEQLYGNIDNVDAWVGMLAEKHENSSMFGELVSTIMMRQFQFLRDGDRFYFEYDAGLSAEEKESIRNTTLHSIIMRNSELESMQENVFIAMPHDEIEQGPILIENHLETTIYPNPTSDQATLTIYSQSQSEVLISIYNSLGQEIHSIKDVLDFELNSFNLEVNQSWIRGMYTVVVESDNRQSVVKLVKE